MSSRLNLVRWGAAVLIAVGGLIHLKLWNDGYRDFPDANFGRSFVANGIGSIIIAAALVAWRHWMTAVAGLVTVNVTLLAFALSRTDRGVFGFTEAGFEPSPEALGSVLVEAVAGGLLVFLLVSETLHGRFNVESEPGTVSTSLRG